jgi:hypothetical protein
MIEGDYMRVDPNSSVPEALNVPTAKPKPSAAASPEQNPTDFAVSARVAEALEKTPSNRADKIAAAKALVQGSDYPNEATLRKIANTLADHMKPQEPV